MCALACSSSKDDGDGPGKGASNTLKVMSFNVRYNSANDEGDKNWEVRKAAVVKMINTVQPDVVGLQEPRTAQRTFLKNNLPNYAYMEVPGTGDGKGGNTCLIYRQDRFTLVDNGYFFLSPTPDEPSRCWDVGDTQWRTSVWVHLKEKETGKEFWFLSTHMPVRTNSSFPNEPYIQARINSANLNVERMKKLAGESGMCFIVGDMNWRGGQRRRQEGAEALPGLVESRPRHRLLRGMPTVSTISVRERRRRPAISTTSSTAIRRWPYRSAR